MLGTLEEHSIEIGLHISGSARSIKSMDDYHSHVAAPYIDAIWLTLTGAFQTKPYSCLLLHLFLILACYHQKSFYSDGTDCQVVK